MTYVAMTRHRDEAQLYASQDHFADHEALKARLGRSGAKETVLDYLDREGRRWDTGKQVGGRAVSGSEAFAQRRGIDSDIVYPVERQQAGQIEKDRGGRGVERGGSPAPAPVNRKETPQRGDKILLPQDDDRHMSPATKKRGMFAGLKLRADDLTHGHDAAANTPIGRGARSQTPALDKAVDRYAKAFSSAAEMQRDGLPALEGQKAALREAQRGLEQAQLGAAGVIESALRYNPAMRQAMMDLSGSERTRTLMTGMAQEREALADPQVRADRFIERWKALSDRHERLQGWQHDKARAPVEKSMQGLAKEIARDPQAESLLRARRQELGLGKMQGRDGIGRELERSIHYRRDRDRGLGL
jgi:hypothetical protein